MNLLSHLRLRTKMALLLGMSAAAMIAIAVIGATTLHQRMLDDRSDKLQSMVSSTVTIAAALEARVVAKEITRQQALEAFRHDIYAIRYDKGVGYMVALDATNGNVVVMGLDPRLEGKPTPADVATGRPISPPTRASQATCSRNPARRSRFGKSSPQASSRHGIW